MSVLIPKEVLRDWAASKPTTKALYVFGSYARGEAHFGSDLDLAFEFTDFDEPDAELICNASAWRQELTQLTGISVESLYHVTALPVTGSSKVQVFPYPGLAASGRIALKVSSKLYRMISLPYSVESASQWPALPANRFPKRLRSTSSSKAVGDAPCASIWTATCL